MTTPAARIVVHDYSGHPGQAQLSRALARRGYDVHHQHCPSYATGKGALEAGAADPPTLSFEPCEMRGAFERYGDCLECGEVERRSVMRDDRADGFKPWHERAADLSRDAGHQYAHQAGSYFGSTS